MILILTQEKKHLFMNGTECRPQAPVAKGGPNPYEGYIGDPPKTLSIFLAPRTPSDNRRGALRSSVSPAEVRRGEPTGLVPPGAGGVRAASGRFKSDVKLFTAFVLVATTNAPLRT